MIVYGAPPITVTWLWAIVRYSERWSERDAQPVSIKIFFPGDSVESISVPVPKNYWGKMPPLERIDDDENVWDPFVSSLLPILITPFVVRKEGMLRVRAFKGEKMIKLGSMRVRIQETQNPHFNAVIANPSDVRLHRRTMARLADEQGCPSTPNLSRRLLRESDRPPRRKAKGLTKRLGELAT